MSDALSGLDSDTLLLLDLDETLIMSSTTLNSSPWWSFIFAKFEDSQLCDAKIFPVLSRILNAVLRHVPFKAVEEDTPRLIAALRARGVPMLGITSRNHSTIFVPASDRLTFRHLEHAGVTIDPGVFARRYCVDLSRAPPELRGGVIFSGRSRLKGQALLHVMDALRIRPARIRMIDDVREQLISVGTTVSKLGIRFTGYRYNRCDNYLLFTMADAIVSDLQLRHLLRAGSMITDAQAKSLLAAPDPEKDAPQPMQVTVDSESAPRDSDASSASMSSTEAGPAHQGSASRDTTGGESKSSHVTTTMGSLSLSVDGGGREGDGAGDATGAGVARSLLLDEILDALQTQSPESVMSGWAVSALPCV